MVTPKAQFVVERDCRQIVGVHVQHPGGDAPVGQRSEAGDGEFASEPMTTEVGIDGNYVDLAHRYRVGVNLGPTEAGELTVEFVQEESLGIKPRLAFPASQRIDGPSTLLGVPRKCSVVYRNPGRLILAGAERSGHQVGVFGQRKIDPHLHQITAPTEAVPGGELVVRSAGV